ncbi:MAG: HAD-IIIA family hydrolase [Blastocatellia bacterium]|nr:HAD-IIIA family hydrolase [Blastocatellia bacterium]
MPENTRKAVFIDRDGTLIEEVDFLSRVEEMRLFEYTRPALESLKAAGFYLFVVTNQSGIARGYFDVSAVEAIHESLQAHAGNLIDGFYHCPHLPDAGCKCRKPLPGMIKEAAEQFGIDLSASWMIGDKALDILAGKNAGTRTILVETGYGAEHRENLPARPDLIVKDLSEAVQKILQSSESVASPTAVTLQ